MSVHAAHRARVRSIFEPKRKHNHNHKKKRYRGRGKSVFKIAIQKVEKALEQAYRDRKARLLQYTGLARVCKTLSLLVLLYFPTQRQKYW